MEGFAPPYFMFPFQLEEDDLFVKVGNAESGIIQLARLNGLMLREVILIEKASLKTWKQILVESAKAYAALAKIDIVEAYNALLSIYSGEEPQGTHSSIEEIIPATNDRLKASSERHKLVYVTTILRSRLVKDWTAKDSLNRDELSQELFDLVYEFARSEEKGGKPGNEESEQGIAYAATEADIQRIVAPADAVNWKDIFWEIQRYWPGCAEFSSQNFSGQPVWRIMQALEAGRSAERNFFHSIEAPTAYLHSTYLAVNSKKGATPITPEKLYLFKPLNKEVQDIPHSAANVFFALTKELKLPTWILNSAPVAELRSRQTEEPVGHPRAMMGAGVLLFNPRIFGDRVYGSMIACDNCSPVSELTDIDQPEITVKVETPFAGVHWDKDVNLKICQ